MKQACQSSKNTRTPGQCIAFCSGDVQPGGSTIWSYLERGCGPKMTCMHASSSYGVALAHLISTHPKGTPSEHHTATPTQNNKQRGVGRCREVQSPHTKHIQHAGQTKKKRFCCGSCTSRTGRASDETRVCGGSLWHRIVHRAADRLPNPLSVFAKH